MFYIFFANGFEEVEAIATLDVIRRAEIEIKSVGIGGKTVVGTHKIPVICDLTEKDVAFDNSLEGIILPGGMPGTTNLLNSFVVDRAVNYCVNNDLLICAICAAPMILGKKGILKSHKAVCFPGFENELSGAEISNEYVCEDGKIITAKGMGSAIEFGLKIVAAVKGNRFAAELKSTLQCPQK